VVDVGYQRHKTGTLNGPSEIALTASSHVRPAAAIDTSVGVEVGLDLHDVFVINVIVDGLRSF